MELHDLYRNTFDYYKLYLKQRTDSFNFFLVLAGLLVSATAVALTQLGEVNRAMYLIAMALSTATSVTSILFKRLDARTRQFIGATETILMSYESELGSKRMMLFTTTEHLRHNPAKGATTMGKVFSCIYYMFFLFGLLGFVASAVLIVM